MPKFVKGQSGNPKGRKAGTKNKNTVKILESIQMAHRGLVKSGKGLQVQAKDDPKWFYQHIFTKIIPRDVHLDVDLGKGLAEAVYGYLAKKDK